MASYRQTVDRSPGGAPTPDISVIIVSWNTRDLLAEAIASVPSEHQGRPVEIIVVDNASGDGSVEMVRQRFPAVSIIESPTNVGFGQANNLGVASSRGRYLLLLNSDAALRPGALAALVDDLEAHPSAAAVGALLVFPDGAFQASYADFPTLRRDLLALAGLTRRVFGEQYPSYPASASHRAREVDWVGGACVLVRREAFETVGGFDPGFHMYTEETDLFRRVHDAGWDVRFTPLAVCMHRGGQSTAQRAAEQPALLWSSRLRYFTKHLPAWQASLMLVAIRASYALRACIWALWSVMSWKSAGDKWLVRARGAARLASGKL